MPSGAVGDLPEVDVWILSTSTDRGDSKWRGFPIFDFYKHTGSNCPP